MDLRTHEKTSLSAALCTCPECMLARWRGDPAVAMAFATWIRSLSAAASNTDGSASEWVDVPLEFDEESAVG